MLARLQAEDGGVAVQVISRNIQFHVVTPVRLDTDFVRRGEREPARKLHAGIHLAHVPDGRHDQLSVTPPHIQFVQQHDFMIAGI